MYLLNKIHFMTKQEKYEQVLREIHAQVADEDDIITRNCFDEIDVAALQELASLVGGKYV